VTDSAPQRVVSLLISADELLWQLGPQAQAKVVGVSYFADDPRYSGVVGQWPDRVKRLRVQSEAIVALDPDLVVAASYTAAEVIAVLKKAQIPTLILQNFNGFDDLKEHIRLISETLHLSHLAGPMLTKLESRLQDLKKMASTSSPRVLSWSDGMVAGQHTSFHQVTAWIGLTNVAAQGGVRGYKRVTLEQIILWDPDWLVVACQTEKQKVNPQLPTGIDLSLTLSPKGTINCDAAIAHIMSTPGLNSLRAVREGHWLRVSGQILSSTGWDLLQLATQLIKQSSI
jgi:iron complex transport system substrate-binding protein